MEFCSLGEREVSLGGEGGTKTELKCVQLKPAFSCCFFLGSNSSNEGIGENSKIGLQIRANCLPQLEGHMDPAWTFLAV